MSPHSPRTGASLPVRVILIKLRPGVDRQEYEDFLRRVDYPMAVTRRSISYYRNHRIRLETKAPTDAEWDYVEYIQATTVEEYDAERQRNPNAEFQRLNPRYVERTVSFWADAVDPGGWAADSDSVRAQSRSDDLSRGLPPARLPHHVWGPIPPPARSTALRMARRSRTPMSRRL